MKVSLLMPTRGRPELAEKSIASLGQGDFEVLAYVDFDDSSIYDLPGARVIKGERFGYERLHEYYNRLATLATGDYLMLWNDDATMETEDWLKCFDGLNPKTPQVLNFWNEADNLFPAISRKFYELQGYFAMQTHVDSWVQQVGERSDSGLYISGMKIIHNKPMDETGQQSTHTAISQTGPEFSSRDVQDSINKDAAKIRRWYEENRRV